MSYSTWWVTWRVRWVALTGHLLSTLLMFQCFASIPHLKLNSHPDDKDGDVGDKTDHCAPISEDQRAWRGFVQPSPPPDQRPASSQLSRSSSSSPPSPPPPSPSSPDHHRHNYLHRPCHLHCHPTLLGLHRLSSHSPFSSSSSSPSSSSPPPPSATASSRTQVPAFCTWKFSSHECSSWDSIKEHILSNKLVFYKDCLQDCTITGCFFNWYPPKQLKYVKPRLGESTLT